MKYVVLPSDAFATEHQKAFHKLHLATEAAKEAFREEVFAVQGGVEEALLRKWKKGNDFEVGWDFNYCYHTCGGIYSDRIFCEDYVVTVCEAVRTADRAGRWTYHTACEIIVNPKARTGGEAMEDRGELFIRGDACYINSTTMKRQWRVRLGCRD